MKKHPLETALTLLAITSFTLSPGHAEERPAEPSRERGAPRVENSRGDKPAPPRPESGRPEPGRPAPGKPDSDKVTFLGVSTAFVPPSVQEHLELEQGFGIQVMEVVPDSPSATAGLRKNDILIQFNDQLLISPEHLSLLVKRESAGAKVRLTLIRKGAEEQLDVVLGQMDRSSPIVRPDLDPNRRTPEQWQDHMKQQQDYWQRWMDQRQPERGKPTPGGEHHPRPETSGRPPAVSVNPGFPVRVFGTDGVIKIDNEEGEVSIVREGDQHRITIKDASGKEIYAGPYEADKGIAGLPESAREHLKKMKLDNLKILTPEVAAGVPEKTSSPVETEGAEAAPEDLL